MKNIYDLLKKKILVLDGAMGTMIQSFKLNEKDFRSNFFKNHKQELKGNNDILSITQPAVIKEIHEKYLNAGADIIETNTFNANRISQTDYGTQNYVYDINFNAAKIAKECALKYSSSVKPRFVAGSIGPTNKSATLAPDINKPYYRDVDFDILKEVYYEQAKALIEGGVDLLLIETVFDTINAKAALFAIDELSEKTGEKIPVMLSVTISDTAGRTLTGQTLESFYISVKHTDLLSVGLNCSFGANQLAPFIKELSSYSKFYISAHPNAGLPDHNGNYNQSARDMAEIIEPLLEKSLVNIIGGCCGTTPLHIKELSKIVKKYNPRVLPEIKEETSLAGLDVLKINEYSNFINIGERTNVAGSRKFARLIREKKYDQAVTIAANQVADGARIIDICMDDPMIDSKDAIRKFINLLVLEPDIAKVPFMLDSSDWGVIETGLKSIPGKCIVNSISLKDGETAFIDKAKKIKKYGAAVVVMLFDEKGQAVTFERKIDIAQRAYNILTNKVNFFPSDIIIDPNILTIATGIPEHDEYAINYIRACSWIKNNLPGVKISGGISNLSYSFRSNEYVRKALHAVFLHHAIKAGMDMGIVNPSSFINYEDIPSDLKDLAEDVILNKKNDATENLLKYAESKENINTSVKHKKFWRNLPVDARIVHSIVNGITGFIEQDLSEYLKTGISSIEIVEKTLMDGMKKTGKLFGEGKMFLPQVIKSARVMNIAVDYLKPYIEKELLSDSNKQPVNKKRVILATVKGDVHDIGKNITGLILSCNNYKVIDLGVMVEPQKIIDTAKNEKADVIGLSGLITPSLEEMRKVINEMQEQNLKIPLIVGGATTSKLHTAIKLAQGVDFPVIHVSDASQVVSVLNNLFSDNSDDYINEIKSEYNSINQKYLEKERNFISINEARHNSLKINWDNVDFYKPAIFEIKKIIDFPVKKLEGLINWSMLLYSMDINGKYPDILTDSVKGIHATKIINDSKSILNILQNDSNFSIRGVFSVFPANSKGDDIIIWSDDKRRKVKRVINFLRNQQLKENNKSNLCLSDYVAPEGYADYLGCFAVTAGIGINQLIEKYKSDNDDYNAILVSLLADRLVEAFAEYLHYYIRTEFWAYNKDEDYNIENLLNNKYIGIRPAPGYPACPDHYLKKDIFDLLEVNNNIGVKLSETFSMIPVASLCGFYFSHDFAKYFDVNKISEDQVNELANKRNMPVGEVEKFIPSNLNYK